MTLKTKYLYGALILWIRSSRSQVFFKIDVLQNLAIFTEKIPVLASYRKNTRVAGFKASSFIEKRLQLRCLPVKFAKFLGTPFLQSISGGCFWILQISNPLRTCQCRFGELHFDIRVNSCLLNRQWFDSEDWKSIFATDKSLKYCNHSIVSQYWYQFGKHY